jgi:hypothetical protein
MLHQLEQSPLQQDGGPCEFERASLLFGSSCRFAGSSESLRFAEPDPKQGRMHGKGDLAFQAIRPNALAAQFDLRNSDGKQG